MKDNKTSRRDFIINTTKIIGVGAVAVSLPQFLGSCEKNEIITIPPPELFTLDLTPYPELLAPGGFKVLKIDGKNGNNPIFIVHHTDGTFKVMSTVCPHQGCIVAAPADSNGTLNCPCHVGNDYSTVDGKGVSGGFALGGKLQLTQYKVGLFNAAKKTLEIEI